MPILREEISDGVFLNTIEATQFKANGFYLNLILPLTEENASYGSLLPNLLCRGTESYPDLTALNAQKERLYGAMLLPCASKIGETMVISIVADFLAEAFLPEQTDVFGGVLELAEEILFRPRMENGVFLPAYVEGEKANRIAAIRALINSKRQYASVRCTEEMCQDEAYAIRADGQVDCVSAMTPASLTEFYHTLLRTARVEIYTVGNMDTARLRERFAAGFGKIARTPIPMPATVIRAEAGPIRRITEELPVEQGKLVMGFRTGITPADPDYAALLVANEMFGGSPTGKLFLHVREKLSLCYYCSSHPDVTKGLLYVSSGVANENRERTEVEVLRQLDAICQGDFSEEEFETAKRGLLTEMRAFYDSPMQMELYYLSRRIGGCDVSPEEKTAQLLAVTREDAIRAAKRIRPDTIYFLKATEGSV